MAFFAGKNGKVILIYLFLKKLFTNFLLKKVWKFYLDLVWLFLLFQFPKNDFFSTTNFIKHNQKYFFIKEWSFFFSCWPPLMTIEFTWKQFFWQFVWCIKELPEARNCNCRCRFDLCHTLMSCSRNHKEEISYLITLKKVQSHCLILVGKLTQTLEA